MPRVNGAKGIDMRLRNRAPLVAGLLALTLSGCDGGDARVEKQQGQAGNEQGEVVVADPVADDVLTAGSTVRIAAEVQGDVAAAGGEVTVAGPVDGYVMSAGRRVALEGRVGNDVWAAGETVDVVGTVGNNAMVAGRLVHLHPESSIGHDASLAGETVTAEGRVERNLRIGAATARIGADVGGAVHARADRVRVLPGAVIRGDLVVRALAPPEIAPEAQVLGAVRYEEIERGGMWQWPLSWLLSFAALLLLALAVAKLAPAWSDRVTATLRAHVGKSFAGGVALLLGLPLAAIALAITLVGIPLAAALLAIGVLLMLLSGVFVAYRVGEWTLARLHRREASRWLRLVTGVALVSLGVSLPAVGWLMAIAVVIAGMGALALERWEARGRLRPAHTA